MVDEDEYKNSTDNNLVEFAKGILAGDKANATQKQYTIGCVSSNAAIDIKKLTGIDVSNFNHVIDGGHIGHIDKRHGKYGEADKSIKEPEDIGRVKYVLDNYDDIQLLSVQNFQFKNSDYTPSKMIRYEKRVNGNYYVIEAVPDVKNKKLMVVSLYKSKAESEGKMAETYHDRNYPTVNVQNESATNNIQNS